MPQIPAGWEETTLGNVIEIVGWWTPKTSEPKYWNGTIPWLSVVDFNNSNRRVYNTEKSITEEGLKSSSTKLLKAWDLIISARGTVWALAQLKTNMAFNQSCYGIKQINWVSDQNFLFYILKNSINTLSKNVHWAVFDTITRETFNIIPIHLPPLPEQKAIAAVLSSFDDKIDLLRAENQTLEQMGQELFKERFGKSPNIKVWMLGDWVDVKRGSSPRPIQDYISEKGYKWLKISDASAVDSPFIFDIKECIREEGLNKTILLKSGTLVLSNSATPGIPKILAVDSCIHDGWLHFPKSRFSNEFLYLLFKEIRPKLIQQGSGSVFTNLKTDILKKYEIPIPDQETLSKFDLVIKPLFNKIRANSEQIQTLSATRDQLLPKLMSGEVRVEF